MIATATPGVVERVKRYYDADPAIFEAEKRTLLARTWQFAGHVSELDNPGDYIHRAELRVQSARDLSAIPRRLSGSKPAARIDFRFV